MARSLRVDPQFIKKVKSALQRNRFPSQKAFAIEMGLARSTVASFLNGKPVDYLNFVEICDKLGLDWQAIAADFSDELEDDTTSQQGVEADSFNADFYVERPPVEELCYQTITQPGALVRVKAPQQMGKTLLMSRVMSELAAQNYRTVHLDLRMAEKEDFSSLEKFLQWFCISVARELNLPHQLAEYWDEQFSTSKVNCTTYFEEYLLAQASTPLVLGLDDVDLVFPYEIAADFLGLLRAWHEKASNRKIWQKLRLVVVHSTEVYIPLKINESPFNVGLQIELPEFTLAQIEDLAQRYGLEDKSDLDTLNLASLKEMVGGHPYLINKAFSHLKNYPDTSLKQLLQMAATEEGIYRNHLRRHGTILQENPELGEALKKVITATSPMVLPSNQAYKLDSMGLVHRNGNGVMPRCNLYLQYFRERRGIVG